MVRHAVTAGGGEYLPSTMSDSDSFCSPWITAIPSSSKKNKIAKWHSAIVNNTIRN